MIKLIVTMLAPVGSEYMYEIKIPIRSEKIENVTANKVTFL